MAASEALGIKGLHSIHFFVNQAERSARFYERASAGSLPGGPARRWSPAVGRRAPSTRPATSGSP
ncbi:MAG: hypothetical protein R3F43_10505 [bacterium]